MVCVGCVTARPLPQPSDEPGFALGPAHAEPDLVMPTHLVTAGQTLYRIAKIYGLSVAELLAANELVPGQPLHVGQELSIPGATAPRPAEALNPPVPPSLASELSPEMAGPMPMSPPAPAPLAWPLRGVLYARFGMKGREPHDGIDLAAPVGTPVKTAAAGSVLFAGMQRGYGNLVIVEHPMGLVTVYAHNRDLRVKTGQRVREGQVIATVGESGRTSGPHLHFEVRQQGVPVDPMRLLGAPPAS